MPAGLRVVVGSDRAGAAYCTVLVDHLHDQPRVQQIITTGTGEGDVRPYPEIALAAAQLIGVGLADRALLVCHTGVGMAIAANKVTGIRAATAHDPLSVEHAVTHNNAQVLCLGAGVIGLALAQQLTKSWLNHSFDPASRAAARIALITDAEHRRRSALY
ncbi:RpiB/LacA/LacB family sugar-phosphate isomerase [Streptomyces clavuligerus]|nr:RpiB/LacA/LacB family sugar-phosphate isomerase [Streptomyces clavuligerus]ANW22212.1 D-erythrulose-4-phosphate isomerase 1 [Streptomyces clavuligerus]AXU17104.1 RpiB/LacA/LacB family sugar-phosphate isomerase [Streptomyces clavuligerus]MBY6307251.1 RpiB/LacA/LacB family sugar-phosphate isomerase [Streptomyces clavuligerus]QCS10175.1 RpiB/LacA/LacB family sugar-phosphate isomerase [Streptomyces clavuligerus]QPJ97778.1 RpiB/LacA/LacB family sugar-phosphate isomerase [Streptomyces clavuligeru